VVKSVSKAINFVHLPVRSLDRSSTLMVAFEWHDMTSYWCPV